jgi:hypothetical protein
VRVYQFRHFGSFRMVFNEQSGIDQGFYLLGCGDAVITVENGVGVGAPVVGEGRRRLYLVATE